MKRRALLALLAGAAAGRLARPRRLAAQTRVRLGYLSGGRREDNVENTVGVLRDSLRELGWRPGENIIIEERWARDWCGMTCHTGTMDCSSLW